MLVQTRWARAAGQGNNIFIPANEEKKFFDFIEA